MLVLSCKEGAVLDVDGACDPVDFEWLDIVVFEMTNGNPSLDPAIYGQTFMIFFAVIASFAFAGMGVRTALKLIKY